MTEHECRLLIDPPAGGAWNMAVDEMLLEWSAAAQQACLRFYRWQPSTLSLGYFQSYGDRREHPASRDCDCVRRLTGGGAILHDCELTYSLVLPARHRLAARRDQLYDTVHGSLIEALADWGVRAAMVGAGQDTATPQRTSRPPASREPFLCFQRRAASDVLLGQTKIAGSAQRRRRGAVLQHGSVLLGRSRAAPELPGLGDLLRRPVSADELLDPWQDRLAAQLRVAWRPGPLSAGESRQAAVLVETRYATKEWTEGVNPSSQLRGRSAAT